MAQNRTDDLLTNLWTYPTAVWPHAVEIGYRRERLVTRVARRRRTEAPMTVVQDKMDACPDRCAPRLDSSGALANSPS